MYLKKNSKHKKKQSMKERRKKKKSNNRKFEFRKIDSIHSGEELHQWNKRKKL